MGKAYDNCFDIEMTFDNEATFKTSFGEMQMISTSNYNDLYNKPKLNDVVIEGEKVSNDYHLQDKMYEATTAEIEAILYID